MEPTSSALSRPYLPCTGQLQVYHLQGESAVLNMYHDHIYFMPTITTIIGLRNPWKKIETGNEINRFGGTAGNDHVMNFSAIMLLPQPELAAAAP